MELPYNLKSLFMLMLAWVSSWLASVPDVIWVLGTLTVLDLVFGIGEHYINKDVSAREARIGAVRKIFQLVLVYAACVGEKYVGFTAGVGKVMASYCSILEVLSIVEHYVAMGGSIPKPLLDALVNVRSLAPKTATAREISDALKQANRTKLSKRKSKDNNQEDDEEVTPLG